MKARITALEADAADMISRTSSLENVVRGQGGTIALASTFGAAADGDDLESRVALVKTKVDDLKGRVTTLQHVVTGLQVGKNGESALLDKNGKQMIPLKHRVVTLEQDLQVVKASVIALETTVGMESRPGPATLLERSAEAQAPAVTLKVRVTTLESDETDIQSRVASLENVVRGKGGDIALSAVHSFVEKFRVDYLEGRVGKLRIRMDELKGRVTSLQHVITGLQLH